MVPGVRAAAGKAVSSQSNLIFASPLVDCNWLRLRRCESLCFYAALMSLYDFLVRTPHPASVQPIHDRPMGGLYACYASCVREIHGVFAFFASASRARATAQLGRQIPPPVGLLRARLKRNAQR